MPDIAEVRQKYPQYKDMSDDQLGDALHKKFYADMPRDEFNKKIGLSKESPSLGNELMAFPRGVVGGISSALSAGGRGAQAEMSEPIDVPDAEETRGILEKNITGELPKPQTFGGRALETTGEFLGSPGTWLGPGGPAGKAISATSAAIFSELAGDLFKGTKAEPYARIGAAAVGGAVPRGAARVVTPQTIPQNRLDAAKYLRSEGVGVTAGDLSGSKALRYSESTLGDSMASGGAYSNTRETILKNFTRAVVKRMGENAEHATPEVIQGARDRAASMLESAAQKLPVHHDAKLGNDLVSISADLMKEGLPEDAINRITKQIENVQSGFVTKNKGPAVMDGKTYQALTRKNTPLARAIDDADPNISYYAVRIRSALDDAMERTATGRGTREGVGRRQALEDLRDARRQWYNSMVISRAAAGPGEMAAEGIITPQKLRQLLTSSDDKKIQYALNRGDLSELAHAGNFLLGNMPNSGTAQRSFIQNLAGLVGAALASHSGDISTGLVGGAAGLATPGLAGRALMSRPVQGYLSNTLLAPAIEGLPSNLPAAGRGALDAAQNSPLVSGAASPLAAPGQ